MDTSDTIYQDNLFLSSLACSVLGTSVSHQLLKSVHLNFPHLAFFSCNNQYATQQISTQELYLVWLRALTAQRTPQKTVQTTQDELVNIIYMAEATQRLALHNNDKALRAQHDRANPTMTRHEEHHHRTAKLKMQLDFTKVNLGQRQSKSQVFQKLLQICVARQQDSQKDRDSFPGNTGMFC